MTTTTATPAPLRYGLVALGVLGTVDAGVQLVSRHSDSPALWAGVAVLAVATALFAVPGARSTLWIRLICIAVLVAAGFGVAEYLLAVPDPAGIDDSISDYWSSLSPLTRSAFGEPGATTPLAPGMLGQAALLLLLATLGRRRARATV